MKKKLLATIILFLIVIIPSLSLDTKPDHIIINSQKWQDVYSGMLFANELGVPSNFLTSTRHATILLYSIPTTRDNILVLTSKDKPFIVGYEDILRSKGYSNPVEIKERNLNLRLAKELAKEKPDMNKYIIIDDAYGYNAISVAPFAARAGYFVLFANKNNIDDIDSFLEKRKPEKIILYGQLNREVKNTLKKYNPEIINLGDRFDNNIAIVKKYQEQYHSKQVILTNGEFIESSLLSGADPVLFLGKNNVPEQIRDYIKNSEFEVGILIGNELIGSATFIRRTLGISVFVKFAQGARQPSGAIAKVEDLDRFPMPSYDLLMDVNSIVYNKATGALEVTYKNEKGMALFFKSTITIRDSNSQMIAITGDKTPIFLDGNEYKTVLYLYDVDGKPLNLQGKELKGDIFVVYGEGKKSLENTLEKHFNIEIIDVLDDSLVNATDLYYDKGLKKFFVKIKNRGEVGAYVRYELIDLNINDELITIGSDKTIYLKPGQSKWIPASVEMKEEDFNNNKKITVRYYYGERELSLIKIGETTFELRFGGYERYVIYSIVLIIIILLLFFLGTKKKCPNCGYKNPRGRKKCMKCGYSFKKR